MRSSLYGPEEFLLKSKKPRIQALIADIANMSIKDIEMLDEKSDIRRGLLNIKKKQEQTLSAILAERIADLMIAKHHPELLDKSSNSAYNEK